MIKWATVLFVVFCQSVALGQDCTLRQSQDSVFIRQCVTANSPFKTIIADFEVTSTLSQYVAKVLDIDNYPKWQYGDVQSSILQVIDEDELYYYSLIKAPWPVSNRDVAYHLRASQDSRSKVVRITLNNVDGLVPEKQDVVRIPSSFSTLTLTPLSATRLKVNFVMNVDPGGEVPAWIVNMFATKVPWETFRNIRNLIEREGLKHVELNFVQDY